MADIKCTKCGIIYCDCSVHTCTKANLDKYRLRLAQLTKEKVEQEKVKREFVIKLNLPKTNNNT